MLFRSAGSLASYGVKHGGKKGNITLVSFDGKYKVTRRVQDRVIFDERLIAAKALIDECLKDWSKGSNANIKALVNNAFAVDSEGAVSVARVMGLKILQRAFIELDGYKTSGGPVKKVNPAR